ncbi:unnamed protein product [Leptidea sinapis]|uniref:Uncharacterized protein n=1 Tax=Leptidea sinapis TaxID=189913 RepID=A0A5E4QDN1_9NEOP|nr:unnamed protein product [Leptidea sinapis]
MRVRTRTQSACDCCGLRGPFLSRSPTCPKSTSDLYFKFIDMNQTIEPV